MASSPRPFALVSASAAIRPHARDSLMVVDAEITDRNLNRNSDLLIRAIMDPLPDKARLSLASNPHSSPVLAVPRPTSPLAVPPLPLVQSPTLFPGIQVAPLPPAAAAPDASVIGPLGDVMDVDSLPQSSSSAAFSLQHPDRIPSLSSDKDDEDAMLDDLYDAVKSTVGRLKTANSFSSLSLQEHPLQPPVDINRMGVNFQILQSHQPHSAQDQITMDESVPATALLSLSGLEIKDKAVDASTMASTPFLNQTGTTSPSKRASSTRRVLSFLKSIDAAFGLDPDAGENADIDDEATASSGATEKVVRRVSLKKRLSNSASVGNSGGLASNK
ncbi:hypothetical protein HDU83_008858 [Entophlyctis luteolus]|nr:hypothetical protein HDU83_008858 [Entophlyctis luteolus]